MEEAMFQDKLPTARYFDVIKAHNAPRSVTIEVEARRVLLSDNPNAAPTRRNAWRYIREGSREDLPGVLPVALGPIFDVRRGVEVKVTWVNELGGVAPMQAGDGPTLEMPPVNPVDMEFPEPLWRAMNPTVGVVTHLHGGKVQADSDGWPLKPASFLGNPYGFPNHLHTTYPNDQRAGMMWFHDHAMDNTSPQVHAGLAGLYFIRDASDDALFGLIGGPANEIPLVIQDRKFDCRAVRVDFWAGVPTATPDFERPEFLGETIVVNGRPTPFVELSRKIYRLRIVNGSNARTYALALVDPAGWAMMSMPAQTRVWHSDLLTVIGNDGGLFPKSRQLAATDSISIGPGERLDVLLDLTAVDPMIVSRLRVVNLALTSALSGAWPEGIFQTTDVQVFGAGVAAAPSSLVGAPVDEFDRTLLGPLLALSCANVMEICLDPVGQPAPALNVTALEAILQAHATEDGFEWKSGALGLPSGAAIAANRFIVLMNNTAGLGGAPPFAQGPWRDTQIWELTERKPAYNPAPFAIPFDIDLNGASPAAGGPSNPKDYFVSRWSFFANYPAAKRIDQAPFGYDTLNANVIKAKAGTYERWYVANLTNGYDPNAKVLSAGSGGDAVTPPTIPDMHTFHMHLVNFVVTRRWRLDAQTKAFAPVSRALDFDGVCRHDTVRVEANELVELLVYFPPGYTGTYPYHCHLVEHEDMGMMSHFEVV
jgi:FtsP/CotA-like multicopper oxidase with cupredoxin domain